MLGIVLIDKAPGITSHDVVDQLRRRFGTRRVGHAGTLDPLASGLLVVAVGPATRFLQYLALEPKVYVASVRFGAATSTYDAEGVPTGAGALPADLAGALESVLPAFRGLIQQLPPMHSAVKVNGKPLYTYARRGEEVERRLRTVHIDELRVDRLEGDVATILVQCSGGTYVRTLAHDIGAAIGCGAHLVGLVRTQVGRFLLSNAARAESVGPEDLVGLRAALEPAPAIALTEEEAKLARDGRFLHISSLETEVSSFVVLLDSKGGVVGIGRVGESGVHPECVLPRELAGHV